MECLSLSLAEGLEFTGFHRIERDLWFTGDISASGPMADRLMANIEEIVARAKRRAALSL